MPDIVLDQIQGDDIEQVWPLLATQFERAFHKAPSPLTLDELKERAHETRVALWAIYERDKPLPLLGAAATCVRRGVTEILVVAGSDWLRWGRDVLSEFETLARANHMTSVRFWGRRGWARLLPDYTTMTVSGRKILMEKPL